MLAELTMPRGAGLLFPGNGDRVESRKLIGTGRLNPIMETELDRIPAIFGGPNIVTGGKPLAVLENGAVIYENASVRGRRNDIAGAPLEVMAAAAEWIAARFPAVETPKAIERWVAGENITDISPNLVKLTNAALILTLFTAAAAGGVAPPRGADAGGNQSGPDNSSNL